MCYVTITLKQYEVRLQELLDSCLKLDSMELRDSMLWAVVIFLL